MAFPVILSEFSVVFTSVFKWLRHATDPWNIKKSSLERPETPESWLPNHNMGTKERCRREKMVPEASTSDSEAPIQETRQPLAAPEACAFDFHVLIRFPRFIRAHAQFEFHANSSSTLPGHLFKKHIEFDWRALLELTFNSSSMPNRVPRPLAFFKKSTPNSISTFYSLSCSIRVPRQLELHAP